jgi:hypothetical protein
LVENRIVDLVQPGGERRPDIDKRGFTGHTVDADWRSSAVETTGDNGGKRVAGGAGEPGRNASNCHVGQRVDRKA